MVFTFSSSMTRMPSSVENASFLNPQFWVHVKGPDEFCFRVEQCFFEHDVEDIESVACVWRGIPSPGVASLLVDTIDG